MSDFCSYLLALVYWWLAAMSAGPFFLDQRVGWLAPSVRNWLNRHPKRLQIYLWIAMCGVFWAGFSAWREEHIKAVSNIKPPLDPNNFISKQISVGVCCRYKLKPDIKLSLVWSCDGISSAGYERDVRISRMEVVMQWARGWIHELWCYETDKLPECALQNSRGPITAQRCVGSARRDTRDPALLDLDLPVMPLT